MNSPTDAMGVGIAQPQSSTRTGSNEATKDAGPTGPHPHGRPYLRPHEVKRNHMVIAREHTRQPESHIRKPKRA